MRELVVHGVPGSPYTRSVLLALEEKGVAYQLHRLAPGSNRTPEHRQLHPFGRIPSLDDGDFRLYETQAILRYIDTSRPAPALRPTSPRLQARMDQIVGIVDCYVFPQISVRISAERFFSERFWGRPCDESIIAKALPEAQNCIEELERLQAGAPYMAGEQVSLADLMLAPHLDYFRKTPEGETLLKERPLGAWMERMLGRASMRATETERLLQAA